MTSCWRSPRARPLARADAFLDQAKATVKAATEKAGTWDGPTTGPAASPGKNVVIVAGDLRNGGHTGVANGAAEAAKALGWTTRIIDGQGTVAGRHLGHEPGDRAQAGRHHHRRLRPRAEHVERRGRRQAGHQDGVLAWRTHAGAGRGHAGVLQRHHRSGEGCGGVGDVRDRQLRRQGRRGRVHRQRLRDRDQEVRRDGGDDQEMRRAAPSSRSRTRRSPTSPTACRS